MNPQEFWFHVIELSVMAFGIALPVVISTMRLWSVLKDYPPHRHINGSIVYPSGYEPTIIERSRQENI